MAIDNTQYYYDSVGVLRDRPESNVDATTARTYEQYGGGFIDYSDNDYTNGIVTKLAANTTVAIKRDLQAPAVNNRINRPFAGFAFWDNTAKLVRGRALYDIMFVSMAIRVIADRINGTLRVSLNTPTIEIGGKNMSLTAPVGTEESMRVDFIYPVRTSLLVNGAEVRMTPSVPMSIIEFSPEFYPLGYEP